MLLNKELNYWQEHDAIFTATEIRQEPKTWLKTKQIVEEKKEALNAFLSEVLSEKEYDVVLTGAGTSEFVGNSLFPYLNTILDYRVKSYGTTDIVSCPAAYLHPERKTLLVSFARSGNSPESVAAVQCANTACKDIHHLFITCNKDGQLSTYGHENGNCFVINLPEETNDKAFAMTSSYSCMYLACLLAFLQYKGVSCEDVIEELSEKAETFFDKDIEYLNKIVDEFDYQRLVYLGSGCLKGVSQETALKSCELTAGNIMTTYDSSMGFRHGPKSVVKDTSLIVVYLADDEYTRQYDADIVKEIAGEKTGKILTVSSHDDEELRKISDYFISFDNDRKHESVFLALEYVLVGQLLGLLKAIHIGNTPDNPCSTGQVSRVVHGVNIYPYKG